MNRNGLFSLDRRCRSVLVALSAVAAVMFAARAYAFDWPAAGGTATIPAGSLVEVTGTDVTTAAACGEIVIESGATLSFTNITANATFAGKISGAGKFSAVNAQGTKKTLTFTGDLSEFTGGMDFQYVHATFNTADSGSSTIKFVESNDDKLRETFTGGFTYNNPLDVTVGGNYGVKANTADTVLAGAITMRGGRLTGPGRLTGLLTLAASCYVDGGIVIEGGVEPNASGRAFESDGGVCHLKSQIGAVSSVCVIGPGGKIIFYGDNLIADSVTWAMGKTWSASHPSGTYDLNGYNQRCKTISLIKSGAMVSESTFIKSATPATLTILNQSADVNYNGQVNGAASIDYSSSGARTFTLSGTNNTTTGALTVRSGTLAIAAAAKFPNLSAIVSTGSGNLSVGTAAIAPGIVDVFLSDSGKLTIASGLVMTADVAAVDGTYLDPGIYTKNSPEMNGHLAGDGELMVVNPEPKGEGEIFTWIGGSDGDLFTSDANWKGGIAPSFDGTERLVFGEGTAQAVVSGIFSAYSVEIVTNASFELKAADEESRLILGAGGLILTNTVDSTVVSHRISCPIELYSLPQTWLIGANTTFSNAAPIVSGAAALPLTIRCEGRPYFMADNSNLLAPLVLTNLTTASQPCIYNMKGLGATNRFTTCWGAQPRFITSSPVGGSLTNETPLRIRSGLTNQEGAYINSSGNAHLYLAGLVSFVGTGLSQSEIYFHGKVHFIGGITNETNHSICFRIAGADEWIEGDGINLSRSLLIDYGGTINISSPSNNWELLCPYKCTVKCHGTNVLAKGKPVRMCENGTYYHGTACTIDLNGYDQSVSRMYRGWEFKTWPDMYVNLASATPAMLEMTTDTVYDDLIALKVTGAAGIKFNMAGSYTFTNVTASTTGTLEVDRGTVRFAAGSGWIATTNIVLNGGTLAVAPGAGAKAFGSAQGRSDAWMTRTDGTVDIVAGEQPTVLALAVPRGNGHFRYLAPGVYGGSSAGLDAEHTLDWITGGGTLRVLRSGDAGTLIMLK
jgi:autotransporter-associated beta strand protein